MKIISKTNLKSEQNLQKQIWNLGKIKNKFEIWTKFSKTNLKSKQNFQKQLRNLKKKYKNKFEIWTKFSKTILKFD
jgi:hypothetical protein